MDAAHAAHRLDHVHRHADGAALVGDRPGDGLADPPGGVGRELVAAGVLELVDRPHQARVALLDQVEEAQAAVAVAFGDGDDQPQVAGGEAAAWRASYSAGQAVDSGDAAAERGGAFQRDPHQVAELLAQARAAAARAFRPARDLGQICRVQVVHLLGDLLELLQDRLQPLRPQAEFLDQPHGPAAAGDQPLPGLRGAASAGCCLWMATAKSCRLLLP